MKKRISTIVLAVVLLQLVMVPLVQAEEKGGVVPCLIGVFINPRAGYQWNEGYKIRTMEWIELAGTVIFAPVGIVVRILQAVEAMNGKTWTEIVQKEALHASHFDTWHNYAAVK